MNFSVAPVQTTLEPKSHRLCGWGWSRRSSAALWLPIPFPGTAAAPGNNLFPAQGSSHVSAGGGFSQQTLPGQSIGLASPQCPMWGFAGAVVLQPPATFVALFPPPRPPQRQLLGAAAAVQSLAGPVNVSIDVTGAFPAFLLLLQETGARSRDSPAVASPRPPLFPDPPCPQGSPHWLQNGSVALALAPLLWFLGTWDISSFSFSSSSSSSSLQCDHLLPLNHQPPGASGLILP